MWTVEGPWRALDGPALHGLAALPVRRDLSSQLFPDDGRFRVAGCSTVKYHVRVLFGNNVLGTFDDPRLLYNDIDTQRSPSASHERGCHIFTLPCRPRLKIIKVKRTCCIGMNNNRQQTLYWTRKIFTRGCTDRFSVFSQSAFPSYFKPICHRPLALYTFTPRTALATAIVVVSSRELEL